MDKVVNSTVVLAICTYRRPELLGQLLPLLVSQIANLNESVEHAGSFKIVVVDNDDAKSASEVVQAARVRMGDSTSLIPPGELTIEYVAESRKGVGFARNAAFKAATGCESLIFFDDDQVPSGQWLLSLLRRHQSYPHDILVGPVSPVLPEDTPSWAQHSDGWGRRVYSDNQIRGHAGFGNILIPGEVLHDAICVVPEGFLRGPGEDTVVTRTLYKAGYVLRSVSEASASEPVDSSRVSEQWLRNRARTGSRAWARTLRYTGESELLILAYAVKALLNTIVSFSKLVFCRGSVYRISAHKSAAQFLGYMDYFKGSEN